MGRSEGTYILAIDLGTSGPKVSLFSSGMTLVGQELEPTALQLFQGGGAEQDPADWWRAIVTASRRLTGRFPVEAANVVAVGCTAQWSGTVAVDGHGEPVGPAILWMDTRGEPYVRALTGGFPSVMGYAAHKAVRWIRLTGGIPSGSGKDPLAHILWLREERPEVYARADKFLEPKDYLNLRLTGRIAASFCSITLHWVTDNRDPDRVTYSDTLLKAAGLPRAKLPDLGRAVDVLGKVKPEVARELGIPDGAQVMLGTPDVHSAAVGSGAVRDFEAHLYIGTSAWLTCHVPFKKTDALHNMASVVSAIPGRYLIGNEQESAGVCLTFLRDNVLFAKDALTPDGPPEDAYQMFDTLAAEARPGAGNVLFTPWLYGERTPVEDPHVRGGFHNVSLRTTRAELVRSVFEGVALNARWLLGAVRKFTGRPLPTLNLIGGGAKSDVWSQIFADVLGVEIRQMEDPIGANARGAAIVTAVGLGLGTFEELCKRVSIRRTYAPEAAHRATYDALFREFVQLYRANRGTHLRLNRASQETHRG